MDFQPFLRGFQSVNEYLNDLIIDINNPIYFQRLTSPFDDVQITSLSNETAIWKFHNSPACKVHPYACQLHYFQTRIYRVHTSLYALWGYIKSLFEYMRALAFQELDPMIIPPDILKKILHKIEEDIRSNARLKLCEDPETNIWSYYGTVTLTPIVLDNYLMLIWTIPLVDQSLHMNLYKVHNLPMLHPTLNVHVQYELEGYYLATMMEDMFTSLPTALDVKLPT